MAAYCEPCSPWWSRTIRTARSRTSGEKGGLRFVMGSILSGSGASEKPGAVQSLKHQALPALKTKPTVIQLDRKQIPLRKVLAGEKAIPDLAGARAMIVRAEA